VLINKAVFLQPLSPKGSIPCLVPASSTPKQQSRAASSKICNCTALPCAHEVVYARRPHTGLSLSQIAGQNRRLSSLHGRNGGHPAARANPGVQFPALGSSEILASTIRLLSKSKSLPAVADSHDSRKQKCHSAASISQCNESNKDRGIIFANVEIMSACSRSVKMKERKPSIGEIQKLHHHPAALA
jgi:hypothetical protein